MNRDCFCFQTVRGVRVLPLPLLLLQTPQRVSETQRTVTQHSCNALEPLAAARVENGAMGVDIARREGIARTSLTPFVWPCGPPCCAPACILIRLARSEALIVPARSWPADMCLNSHSYRNANNPPLCLSQASKLAALLAIELRSTNV